MKYWSAPLIPQALINMGEILKAAGCDHSNGESSAPSRYPDTQLRLMCFIEMLKCKNLKKEPFDSSGEDDCAARWYKGLQQRQRGVQNM